MSRSLWSRIGHALRVVIDGPATTRINDDLRRARSGDYEHNKTTCRYCAGDPSHQPGRES